MTLVLPSVEPTYYMENSQKGVRKSFNDCGIARLRDTMHTYMPGLGKFHKKNNEVISFQSHCLSLHSQHANIWFLCV